MAELHKDLDEKLIVRPNTPFHFMRLKAFERPVSAAIKGQIIAKSTQATMVIEVGADIYEPVIYFPREDIEMSFLKVIEDKSTFCPLKGSAEYFNIVINNTSCNDVAWSYTKPLYFAEKIRDLIAFDSNQVDIIFNANNY